MRATAPAGSLQKVFASSADPVKFVNTHNVRSIYENNVGVFPNTLPVAPPLSNRGHREQVQRQNKDAWQDGALLSELVALLLLDDRGLVKQVDQFDEFGRTRGPPKLLLVGTEAQVKSRAQAIQNIRICLKTLTGIPNMPHMAWSAEEYYESAKVRRNLLDLLCKVFQLSPFPSPASTSHHTTTMPLEPRMLARERSCLPHRSASAPPRLTRRSSLNSGSSYSVDVRAIHRLHASQVPGSWRGRRGRSLEPPPRASVQSNSKSSPQRAGGSAHSSPARAPRHSSSHQHAAANSATTSAVLHPISNKNKPLSNPQPSTATSASEVHRRREMLRERLVVQQRERSKRSRLLQQQQLQQRQLQERRLRSAEEDEADDRRSGKGAREGEDAEEVRSALYQDLIVRKRPALKTENEEADSAAPGVRGGSVRGRDGSRGRRRSLDTSSPHPLHTSSHTSSCFDWTPPRPTAQEVQAVAVLDREGALPHITAQQQTLVVLWLRSLGIHVREGEGGYAAENSLHAENAGKVLLPRPPHRSPALTPSCDTASRGPGGGAQGGGLRTRGSDRGGDRGGAQETSTRGLFLPLESDRLRNGLVLVQLLLRLCPQTSADAQLPQILHAYTLGDSGSEGQANSQHPSASVVSAVSTEVGGGERGGVRRGVGVRGGGAKRRVMTLQRAEHLWTQVLWLLQVSFNQPPHPQAPSADTQELRRYLYWSVARVSQCVAGHRDVLWGLLYALYQLHCARSTNATAPHAAGVDYMSLNPNNNHWKALPLAPSSSSSHNASSSSVRRTQLPYTSAQRRQLDVSLLHWLHLLDASPPSSSAAAAVAVGGSARAGALGLQQMIPQPQSLLALQAYLRDGSLLHRLVVLILSLAGVYLHAQDDRDGVGQHDTALLQWHPAAHSFGQCVQNHLHYLLLLRKHVPQHLRERLRLLGPSHAAPSPTLPFRDILRDASADPLADGGRSDALRTFAEAVSRGDWDATLMLLEDLHLLHDLLQTHLHRHTPSNTPFDEAAFEEVRVYYPYIKYAHSNQNPSDIHGAFHSSDPHNNVSRSVRLDAYIASDPSPQPPPPPQSLEEALQTQDVLIGAAASSALNTPSMRAPSSHLLRYTSSHTSSDDEENEEVHWGSDRRTDADRDIFVASGEDGRREEDAEDDDDGSVDLLQSLSPASSSSLPTPPQRPQTQQQRDRHVNKTAPNKHADADPPSSANASHKLRRHVTYAQSINTSVDRNASSLPHTTATASATATATSTGGPARATTVARWLTQLLHLPAHLLLPPSAPPRSTRTDPEADKEADKEAEDEVVRRLATACQDGVLLTRLTQILTRTQILGFTATNPSTYLQGNQSNSSQDPHPHPNPNPSFRGHGGRLPSRAQRLGSLRRAFEVLALHVPRVPLRLLACAEEVAEGEGGLQVLALLQTLHRLFAHVIKP